MNQKIQLIRNAGLTNAVRRTLPPQAAFKLYREPTGIGSTYVLRVVTDALPAQSRYEKIDRITGGLQDARELDLPGVFRVSVVTPEEWKSKKREAQERLAFYSNLGPAKPKRTSEKGSKRRAGAG